jgi:hypothetical protein
MVVSIAVLSVGLSSGSAQEAAVSKEAPTIYNLQLKKDPGVSTGQAAGVGGSVDGGGHRFLVENINLMQPVAVGVVADDPSKPIEVKLSKYDFESTDRNGTTDGRGVASFRFRTEGDLRILVRSTTPEPAPYSLMVWVGEEVPSEVRGPLVPVRQRSGASGWLSPPVLVGALGLIVLGAIGAFVVSRRGRKDGKHGQV